jgi:hypothetical protein
MYTKTSLSGEDMLIIRPFRKGVSCTKDFVDAVTKYVQYATTGSGA